VIPNVPPPVMAGHYAVSEVPRSCISPRVNPSDDASEDDPDLDLFRLRVNLLPRDEVGGTFA